MADSYAALPSIEESPRVQGKVIQGIQEGVTEEMLIVRFEDFAMKFRQFKEGTKALQFDPSCLMVEQPLKDQ